ncbi:hypothetical protein PMAYCL1PPCAC_21298, partial [Pristionchus mayeri]
NRPFHRRVDVISSTMIPLFEQLIADAAVIAVNNLSIEKEFCRFIKQFLDVQIGPCFHCICGRQFGAYVSSCDNWYFSFRIDQHTFLVFRSVHTPMSSRIDSQTSLTYSEAS